MLALIKPVSLCMIVVIATIRSVEYFSTNDTQFVCVLVQGLCVRLCVCVCVCIPLMAHIHTHTLSLFLSLSLSLSLTRCSYTPYESNNPNASDSEKFGGALLNSLIIIGIVVGMTCVLLVLYKYRCYKVWRSRQEDTLVH